MRGSRKHVLDWTSRQEFCSELLQLVAPIDVRVTPWSRWMPRGHGKPEEARLETFGHAHILKCTIGPLNSSQRELNRAPRLAPS
jgi:hypothetical protein